MAKHRTFNCDKFLDKFHGQEPLLRDFVALWRERLSLDVETFTIDGFKEWLTQSTDEGKDDLLEALYQVYDLCTEAGHLDLLAACSQSSYDPDPENKLPVECLALLVRTKRKPVFLLAYDRYNFSNAERFSIFQGECGRPIESLKKATQTLRRRLATEFKQAKNSERVLVRSYEEMGRVNFVIYHEKRTKATLILKGPTERLKVRPHIFRPAQQDFVSYDPETGRVEIESGVPSEETKLRQCFAESCFGDADFFEGPHADDRISLDVLTDPNFSFRCPEKVTVKLISVRYSLPQSLAPSFSIRSKDVYETMQINGIRQRFAQATITNAVIKFTFPDDARGKRVELSGTKSIKFKRATHAEEVFGLLTEWGILLGAEHDADAEDAFEPDHGPAAFAGSAGRHAT